VFVSAEVPVTDLPLRMAKVAVLPKRGTACFIELNAWRKKYDCSQF